MTYSSSVPFHSTCTGMGLEQAIMKASTCVPCGPAVSLRGTAAQSSPPVCHTQAGEDSGRHAVHT